MKKLFAALSLATALAGCAAPYAPQEFDFSELHSLGAIAGGIVESVQEVALQSELPYLADVFEHPMQPETADELAIRLDSGEAITVRQNGAQRFEPGGRVRVLSSATGMRVEHE